MKQATRRYILFQIPGLVLVVLVGQILERWLGAPGYLTIVLVSLILLKDVALFPVLKHAFEVRPARGGYDRLIGRRGQATTDLDPDGFVRVDGELWKAVVEGTVRSGDEVDIVSGDDLVLQVRAAGPVTSL